MKSNRTKKFARLAILFTILSIFCLLGPASYYVITGLLTAELIIEKVALVGVVFMSIVLTGICAINKVAFRSKAWLFVLALFFVVDKFIVMIMIFAITQIFDELVFSPLARYFRNKATINREIDKRGA